jgi:hypothetical protein
MLASQGDPLGVFQGSFGWIGLLGWVQQELYDLIMPHSIYHCDICILHIVKVIPTIALKGYWSIN